MTLRNSTNSHPSALRCVFQASLLAAAVGLAWTACGCGAPPRPTLTDAQLQDRSDADAQESQKVLQSAIGGILTRMEEKARTATDSEPAVLNILALSGGGDYGAFGAGLLVGWGSNPQPAGRRPDFDAVTGVSTGALLAPFAYVGTDEAYLKVESFYRNPRRNWVQDRGLLFFLPHNPSFMIVKGLEKDINLAISKPFVDEMAAQSANGKLLIISATDLDLGRQKFWDVGQVAAAASSTGNLERLHKILMASAAIPAIFPPVAVDDSLYADGGVTANVFLRLDPHSPGGFVQRWIAMHPGKPLPKTRYWIIINNQLSQTPKTVQPKWPAVMAPALATAVRSATIAEVRWLSAQVDYVNAVYDSDIEVWVAAIPDDWRPPAQGAFVKETMESLADLGRKMGADSKSWRRWNTPVREKRTGVPQSAPATP
ncbi:MAG: patatin-like phospholipase family protein [Planctomycetes bacterium]|nr:patatin-like phospholipase family protein [Planctomycetota bacterium]